MRPPAALLPLSGITLFCILLQVNNVLAVTEDDVIKRLLKNYDPSVRATNGSDQPTLVEVNFFARDFYVIDNSMRYIGAQLTFRQSWNDDRLAYPETQVEYLSLSDSKKLWVPDLFFSNSRNGHFNNLMEPNALLRIFPNGNVLYSRRVTLDFKCSTISYMFPLDKVVCPVIAATYGSTIDRIKLKWVDENPVQISKSLLSSISGLRINRFSTDYCNSKTKTGEYSCLKTLFILERVFGSIFYILYLPSLILVLLGWMSFFMHRRTSNPRLALLLVTLLLGALCCANALLHDPERLVVTAGDAWAGWCLAFVAYALLHFVLTRNIPCITQICGHESKDAEGAAASNDITLQPMMPSEGGEQGKVKDKLHSRLRLLMAQKGNRADIIARILYPSAFIVFNIIYWEHYKE